MGFLILSLITAILSLFWEMFEKTQLIQTVVVNDYDNIVIFKLQNGSEPQEIAPHTSMEGVVGIKVSGKVFKICSGTHVIIDNKNRIKTKAITDKITNTIIDGKIETAPDESWNLLFNA